MKKLILLVAIGAFFLSTKSEAQHFVASFGTYHQWNVPQRVHYIVEHDFYGYNWVHAKRVVRGNYVSFDLILQRGDVFVEVNVGPNGRVIGRTYFDRYPLYSHVCSGYCGYHTAYYNSYRTVCNSHYHHGHNHVRYRPRTTYYVSHNKSHGHGHKYGHYKKSQHHKHNYDSRREPQRRDRYYENKHSRRSDNGSRREAYSRNERRKSPDHDKKYERRSTPRSRSSRSN